MSVVAKCGMVFRIAVAGALGGAGCAAWGGASEVRRTAMVGAHQPAMLQVGPGWLLHVNADRRAPVAVYVATRREGNAVDCVGGGAEGAQAAGAGVATGGLLSHRQPLYVRPDEVACATVPRAANVAWHFKQGAIDDVAPAGSSRQMATLLP